MKGIELEAVLEIAVRRSLTRRSLAITWIALLISGLIFVFCHAISLEIHPWARLGFTFLPYFLSSWVLLLLGALLINRKSLSWKATALESLDPLLHTTLLALPSLLLYMISWIALGFFFLIQQIPLLGNILGTILSIGPYLLILALLGLLLIQSLLLFFAPPLIGTNALSPLQFLSQLRAYLTTKPLRHLLCFCIGWIPVLLWAGILFAALQLTETVYLSMQSSLSLGFNLFFLMIPITFFLTPTIAFLFYFSHESYKLNKN